MMGWGWDAGWGFGGWLMMSLMMIVFWGLPVALVVWLVATLRPGRSAAPTSPEPRPPASRADQVLAERYARGEIGEDEFVHRRQVLHTGQNSAS